MTPRVTQYFAHGLKRWHHSNPVRLGEQSALRVVVEANQVNGQPLEQSADGEMNFRASILSSCFGPR